MSASPVIPRLSATSVSWGVRGRDLVRGVTLDLRAGEVLGLVDPNGAGKSSLLHLLAGLTAPREGRIFLDGTPLSGIPARERAARIGYLPQHVAPHWDYRVRELLRLGLERNRTAPTAGALPALAASFDLAELLDRRWSTLSGGERGRAIAAAVLAPNPEMVLADEPAAALDVAHAAALMRLLRARAADGAAVAVVAHDLNLAGRWCDRIAVMSEGRVLTTGSASAVLADGFLDEAFGVRFRRLATAGAPVVLPDG